MPQVRQPAVADLFYPGDPHELGRSVAALLAEVPPADAPAPKAIIAPHAGYIYSGPVAARAYARLVPARDRIRHVILLGPSHRVPLLGIATSGAERFHTPLGDVPLDRAAIDKVEAMPFVTCLDAAHQLEHSLEVHLPFLQAVLGTFSLVPLVVGDIEPEQVAAVLELLWGGEETLIVVSSDLSHYHDYATAQQRDAATRDAIERLAPESLGHEDACGRIPVAGLLVAARHKGLSAQTLDLRNSGDTAGPRNEVVGYGAWAFA